MSEPILRIEVPGRAVSANARLGYNRHTERKFLTKEARAWKKTVAECAWASCVAQGKAWSVHPYPLRIVCHVYGTRADADNLSKLLLDGLKEGIGVDDRHYRTVEMHATAKGLKQPRTIIEVYRADEQAA
jgi:Holliday junction resolvase RusA-like endonuclease